MDNQSLKLLYDIQASILKIESYVGEPKVFENFNNSSMLRDAVERNLEIIGEAMNRLLKIQPDVQLSYSRRIVDTRNKIIHGYDEIEPVNIWTIVINYLPLLKKEVIELLEKHK